MSLSDLSAVLSSDLSLNTSSLLLAITCSSYNYCRSCVSNNSAFFKADVLLAPVVWGILGAQYASCHMQIEHHDNTTLRYEHNL